MHGINKKQLYETAFKPNSALDLTTNKMITSLEMTREKKAPLCSAALTISLELKGNKSEQLF